MAYFTLKNGSMEVTVSSCGGVLHEMKKDGVSYLWNGDPKVWGWRDHNLFPFVGRLPGGKYWTGGKEYSLPLHGFCIDREFTAEQQGENRVVCTLRANAETLAMYPFDFVLRVTYTLEGCTLSKQVAVENTGETAMYFGLGFHPGFRVPLDHGDFSDWYVAFSRECSPVRTFFHPETLLRLPGTEPFALEDGRILRLSHPLFAQEAIALHGAARSLTLGSEKSSRSVTVSYPDTPCITFWASDKEDAPCLCIEPWHSLPAYHGKPAVFEEQEDLIRLEPGEIFRETIEITLN